MRSRVSSNLQANTSSLDGVNQPFRFAGAQSESTRQQLAFAFALVEFTQAVFEQRSTS